MGYVTLEFLGKEFQVSEAVKDFLHYDQLLNPVRAKTLQMLSQDIKRDATRLTFSAETSYHLQNRTAAYQKLLEECAEVLVNELFARGVYDVSPKELLSQVSYAQELENLVEDTMTTVLHEGQRYSDMQDRGIERAYRSAASNITGSGVTIFTSSITTLMLTSAVEYGILSRQAKQADKEYDEAVRAITQSTIHAVDKMTCEVVIKQFYPSLMNIVMDFMNKIMPLFLYELASRGKFDFESMEKNSLTKAEQMLTNLSRVPDKIEFLQQIFVTCPYYTELYETCLNQGVLDAGTFQTAEYFGLADELIEKMDGYIHKNLQSKQSIEPIIAILAKYRNTDELAIWRNIYSDTIFHIENTYKNFNLAIESQSDLDKFIRQFVDASIANVARKNEADISKLVSKAVCSVVSQERYSEFIEMELLHPENIRIAKSSSVELSQINAEIINELTVVAMAYVEEAKRRLELYEKSKAVLNEAIKMMQSEIDRLKAEKERLGFFAFSKKKELSLQIEQKERERSAYEKTHESKRLWNDLEKMYR